MFTFIDPVEQVGASLRSCGSASSDNAILPSVIVVLCVSWFVSQLPVYGSVATLPLVTTRQ